jgi:hypothetical protein
MKRIRLINLSTSLFLLFFFSGIGCRGYHSKEWVKDGGDIEDEGNIKDGGDEGNSNEDICR